MNGRAFVATALILAACSSDGDSSAGSTDTGASQEIASTTQAGDPCGLISDAEMSEAIGAAVTAKSNPAANSCLFSTADALVFASVEIDRDGAAAWQGINAGDSLIGAPQDSLAGVGDKAFFGPRDRLYVLKGNTFAAIEAGFDDKVRDRARRIAKVLVPRI